MSEVFELLERYCGEGVEWKLLGEVATSRRGVRVVKIRTTWLGGIFANNRVFTGLRKNIEFCHGVIFSDCQLFLLLFFKREEFISVVLVLFPTGFYFGWYTFSKARGKRMKLI